VKVRFCGFGGQGILVAGRILGEAVTASGGNVVQNQAYGSASRGGTCHSDVTISDEEIYELEPQEFDALVALSQQACDKFLPMLKADGLLLTDSDLVKLDADVEKRVKHHSLSATEMAHHKFNRDILANIIMIGLLNGITGMMPDDVIENAITTVVPPGTEEINIQAYRLGRDISKEEKRG
jgi:2-oxoglutarate ferredoxin oxidoreductase subunit gamma